MINFSRTQTSCALSIAIHSALRTVFEYSNYLGNGSYLVNSSVLSSPELFDYVVLFQTVFFSYVVNPNHLLADA